MLLQCTSSESSYLTQNSSSITFIGVDEHYSVVFFSVLIERYVHKWLYFYIIIVCIHILVDTQTYNLKSLSMNKSHIQFVHMHGCELLTYIIKQFFIWEVFFYKI